MKRNISVPRSCPCCGNSVVVPQFTWSFDQQNLVLRLGRCTSCNMVYVTNSDEIDMTNQQYVNWEPDTDDDPVTPSELLHNQGVLDSIAPHVSDGADILDYGAGYCGFLRVAKSAGYEVEGINPCLYLADWARKKLDIKIHAVFGQDFEPDKKFDLIVSDQVFEHLENPLKDLGKIHSLLKENGMVYLNVPNLHMYRRFIYGDKCLRDVSHYNYFTLTTLTTLCRNAGFRVICAVPATGAGVVKRILKSALNRFGLSGDCGVLLQK